LGSRRILLTVAPHRAEPSSIVRLVLVLPASFLGYMGVLLTLPNLAQGSHLPFWLELLIAAAALAVLAYGLHVLEGKSRA